MINNLVTCGKHSNHSSVSKSQNFVQEKKKEPFQNVVQWSQVWNVSFGESRGRAANFSFLPLSHSPSRQGNVFIPACFLLSVSCIVLVCTRDKKHVLVQTWRVASNHLKFDQVAQTSVYVQSRSLFGGLKHLTWFVSFLQQVECKDL